MLRALAALLAAGAAAQAPAPAADLRTSYLTDPTVIAPDAPPRFSWRVASAVRGDAQSAYWLQVWARGGGGGGGAPFWDSGKVPSAATAQVAYGGPPLPPDAAFAWNVTWWDAAGQQAAPSALAAFGTGPAPSAWAPAQWIGCTGATPGAEAHQLRFEFPLAPPSPGATIALARLYVSGLGWHTSTLNGRRLGRAVLEPAFTSLRNRVLYVAHDVTGDLSTARPNVYGALLGSGWPDVLAPWGPNNGTGAPPWNGTAAAGARALSAALPREALQALTQRELDALIAQGYGHGHTGYERRLLWLLSVQWSDGSSSSLTSAAASMGAGRSGSGSGGALAAGAPGAWACGAGSLLAADLYGGCTIDARKESAGWLEPGYNFSTGVAWAPAVRIAQPGGALYPATFPGVEEVGELPPRAMWVDPQGNYIFDLGQNFAGGVRLALPGPTPAGLTITVRHAEAVQHGMYGPKDGSLYYGNLRSAEATDTYTTAGSADGETFFPLFTWHGFRYVSVSGLPSAPTLQGVVTGVNYRSAVATVGNIAFPASAYVLDQLQHAIQWGQASNLLGNPSDCPQRDERLGWSGDSALTGEEAALNYDMSAFLSHWADTISDSLVADVYDKTFKSGGLPETIPDVTGGYDADSSWSSVFPSTIYTVWKAYGDAQIVGRYWSELMLFVNHTVTSFKGSDIKGIFHTWGDWCPPPATPGGGQGPKPSPAFTAGISFLLDLQHIVEMAEATASPDLPAMQALYEGLVAQFNADWLVASAYYGSSPTDGAQTAQACAMALGIVPPASQAAVSQYLVQDIAAHGGAMSVGIIGNKFLHRALTAAGQAWLAANISMQTDYPSFGWTFNHPDEPATTLWELWDGPSERVLFPFLPSFPPSSSPPSHSSPTARTLNSPPLTCTVQGPWHELS